MRRSGVVVGVLLAAALAWGGGAGEAVAQASGDEAFRLRPQGLLLDEPGEGPTGWTVGITGVSLVALFSTELFKEQLAPDEPRVSDPNFIDHAVRDALHWEGGAMKVAATTSDVLLFGVFGTSPFWMPFLSDLDYLTHMEINLEALLFTALLTQTVKFAVARQRPYAEFGSLDSHGVDDHLSFFSGHTSLTFALATSNAVILSRAYPDYKALAWGLPLGLAATTGYLRIAADRHYLTDVSVGLVTGLLIGYFVTDWRLDRWARAQP